jgi:hypothetical protein
MAFDSLLAAWEEKTGEKFTGTKKRGRENENENENDDDGDKG